MGLCRFLRRLAKRFSAVNSTSGCRITHGLHLLMLCVVFACRVGTAAGQPQPHFHTPPNTTHPMMRGQEHQLLPSLLVTDSGKPVTTREDWNTIRKPELLQHWTQILGKLQPTAEDRTWFGDVTQAREVSRRQMDGYVRIELQLPMERDFLQPHLLLVPDNAAASSHPAVIAWTSTSPDYAEPEKWWGEWLAQHGYVVLTGWSFIRNYRDQTSYQNGVNQKVYDRFGHWLPMSRMVYDVQREVEFLKSLPQVDEDRIGFMGFSLSAKTALYVAAFAPEIRAAVSIDPHIALNGHSNYLDPWYLDARRKFDSINTADYPAPELRNTPWSLLDANPQQPGFERNHHELLALCAPRAVMVIGCSTDQWTAAHSDDQQSQAYVDRAREVFDLLGVSDNLRYVPLTCGHRPTDPAMDPVWQAFFALHLQGE